MNSLTLKICRLFSVYMVIPAVCAVLLISGCASLEGFGGVAASLAKAAGATDNQAQAIGSAAESLKTAFETLTPEQEYYLGRSVAANIMVTYPPLGNDRADEYLNTLGQTLAMASDKPHTFRGYRFLLLDSEDINAFAAPGGFILITRGMLRCASDEAMLAAVLAHEIGHVQLNHGVKAIKASRWTDAITKTAVAGVSMTSAEMAEVTTAFSGSIGDVTQTLVVNGYSKDQEKQADEAAAVILARVGYDPESIVLMLQEMKKRWKPGSRDFAATHPSPDERISKVRKTVDSLPEPKMKTTPARVERYKWAFNGVI